MTHAAFYGSIRTKMGGFCDNLVFGNGYDRCVCLLLDDYAQDLGAARPNAE